MPDKDYKYPYTCPKCEKTFEITQGQLENGETIVCPNCQEKFDTSRLMQGLKGFKINFGDIGKNIGKNIKFKFKF